MIIVWRGRGREKFRHFLIPQKSDHNPSIRQIFLLLVQYIAIVCEITEIQQNRLKCSTRYTGQIFLHFLWRSSFPKKKKCCNPWHSCFTNTRIEHFYKSCFIFLMCTMCRQGVIHGSQSFFPLKNKEFFFFVLSFIFPKEVHNTIKNWKYPI